MAKFIVVEKRSEGDFHAVVVEGADHDTVASSFEHRAIHVYPDMNEMEVHHDKGESRAMVAGPNVRTLTIERS